MEWIFNGRVAMSNDDSDSSGVEWNHDNRVTDEILQEFPKIRESLKASFSRKARAKIEYIVIVANFLAVMVLNNLVATGTRTGKMLEVPAPE